MSVQGGLGRCCSGRGFPCVLCVTLVLLALWCLSHSIQRVWQMPGLQVRRGGSRELAEFGSLGVCEEGAPPASPSPQLPLTRCGWEGGRNILASAVHGCQTSSQQKGKYFGCPNTSV